MIMTTKKLILSIACIGITAINVPSTLYSTEKKAYSPARKIEKPLLYRSSSLTPSDHIETSPNNYPHLLEQGGNGVSNLEENLNTIKDQLKDQIENLTNQVNTLNTENTTLTTNITTQSENLTQTRNQLTNQVQDLSNQIANLQNDQNAKGWTNVQVASLSAGTGAVSLLIYCCLSQPKQPKKKSPKNRFNTVLLDNSGLVV